jgi:hypothetical protein
MSATSGTVALALGGSVRPWTVLSSEVAVAERWLRGRSDRCATPDGAVDRAPTT